MYRYLILLLIFFSLASCQKQPEYRNKEPPYCESIPVIYIDVENDEAIVSVVDTSGKGFDFAEFTIIYKSHYVTIREIFDTSFLHLYNLENGSYDVTIRGGCGNGYVNPYTTNSVHASFTITNGKPFNNNCAMPLSLKPYDRDKDAVGCSFSANPAYYEFACGPPDFDPDTAYHFKSSSSGYVFYDLQPGQQYTAYVRNICSSGLPGPWSFPVTFTAAGNPIIYPCVTPADLSATAYLSDAISLSWNAYAAIGWELVYSKDNIAPSDTTAKRVFIQQWSTPYTDPQLQFNTKYYIHIRSVCSDHSVTPWYSTNFTVTR